MTSEKEKGIMVSLNHNLSVKIWSAMVSNKENMDCMLELNNIFYKVTMSNYLHPRSGKYN